MKTVAMSSGYRLTRSTNLKRKTSIHLGVPISPDRNHLRQLIYLGNTGDVWPERLNTGNRNVEPFNHVPSNERPIDTYSYERRDWYGGQSDPTYRG